LHRGVSNECHVHSGSPPQFSEIIMGVVKEIPNGTSKHGANRVDSLTIRINQGSCR
jgi:hypothetical protein